MAVRESWVVDENDLTRNANHTKETVLSALREAGYLTIEQETDLLGRLSIVVTRAGWLGRMWAMIRKHDPKDVITQAVWTDPPPRPSPESQEQS